MALHAQHALKVVFAIQTEATGRALRLEQAASAAPTPAGVRDDARALAELADAEESRSPRCGNYTTSEQSFDKAAQGRYCCETIPIQEVDK